MTSVLGEGVTQRFLSGFLQIPWVTLKASRWFSPQTSTWPRPSVLPVIEVVWVTVVLWNVILLRTVSLYSENVCVCCRKTRGQFAWNLPLCYLVHLVIWGCITVRTHAAWRYTNILKPRAYCFAEVSIMIRPIRGNAQLIYTWIGIDFWK